MMIARTTFVFRGVFCAALAAGMFFSPHVFALQTPPVGVKLQLNWKPEPQFGGFYAANVAGHALNNGLALEVVAGGAGTPVVQMVASGQADFGVASADEVVMSRAHGSDVVALFASFQINPQGLMAHAERGFKSIADVYQQTGTLAIQKGLPYALFLAKKFPQPKAKVVPYLGGIQNFLADRQYSQQCFVPSEPVAAQKQGARVQTFLVADQGYNPYTTVLITRAEVLKKKGPLVKALVAAVRAGWRAYLDDPTATNQLMMKLNPSMDVMTLGESARAQKPLIETRETGRDHLGLMTSQRWKELNHQLIELKLVDREIETSSLFASPD